MKLKKFLETASTTSMRPLSHESTVHGAKSNKVTRLQMLILLFRYFVIMVI